MEQASCNSGNSACRSPERRSNLFGLRRSAGLIRDPITIDINGSERDCGTVQGAVSKSLRRDSTLRCTHPSLLQHFTSGLTPVLGVLCLALISDPEPPKKIVHCG